MCGELGKATVLATCNVTLAGEHLRVRAKWVRHCATLLARVLTRACVLLSSACVLACRVVKNFKGCVICID